MKFQDKELAPSTLGHWGPLEQRRVPCLGLPLSRDLKARASKQTWQASLLQMGLQPEKEREREGEREGEKHRGSQISKKLFRETSPGNWSILYCPKTPFILLIVHRYQWVIQNYAVSAALTLIETMLFLCILSCIHKFQVIYFIFQPEGQLTFHGPFLIRVCQPEDLFVLKCCSSQSLVPLSESTK